MSASDIFTALGVVVAGLAALLAGYFSRKTLEYSSRAEGFALTANEHADHANILSAHTWLDQYLCNVRAWADEACECISMAIHSKHLEESRRSEALFTALHKISALIDRGRWFFPNQWSDEYGKDKEPAYRGIRQPILDQLVESYDLIKEIQKSGSFEYVLLLTHSQRLFVSEVQQVLDPRRRNEEVQRIYQQFAISEKLRKMPGNQA
jgi:predicted component of type VI protein secretion system